MTIPPSLYSLIFGVKIRYSNKLKSTRPKGDNDQGQKYTGEQNFPQKQGFDHVEEALGKCPLKDKPSAESLGFDFRRIPSPRSFYQKQKQRPNKQTNKENQKTFQGLVLTNYSLKPVNSAFLMNVEETIEST